MLLRVGIDKGIWWRKASLRRVSDGAYSPIFEDGTFEFIHKSEESRYPISELDKINWVNMKTQNFWFLEPQEKFGRAEYVVKKSNLKRNTIGNP